LCIFTKLQGAHVIDEKGKYPIKYNQDGMTAGAMHGEVQVMRIK